MNNLETSLTRTDAVLSSLPFVRRVAYRMAGKLPDSIDRNDLVQAGSIGLIQAVDNYDHSVCLETFAFPRIRGAMIDEIRGRDVLSKEKRRKVREIQQTRNRMEQANRDEVSDFEVAKEMNISLDEINKLQAQANISSIDIDEAQIPSSINFLNEIIDKNTVNQVMIAMGQLSPKERTVICKYYFDEMPMREIGASIGRSESAVSLIHKSAIRKLRNIVISRL